MSEPPLEPTPNRALYPILDALRTCMVTQLTHVNAPVCFLPVIWGDSPLPAQRCDCTCEGGGHGEGWVRIVRIEQIPSMRSNRNRSNASSGGMFDTNCGPRRWNITIETGVWRCAPTLDDQGNAPSDAEYDAYTQAMLNDSMALGRVWRCCTWLKDRDYPHQADTSAPQGPQGGCGGVIVTGRLLLDECAPCP